MQDDWKVTSSLTLNLGLRYELFTQCVDARDLGSLFNIKNGQFALPGKDGYSRAIVNGDHNNFGPRAGLCLAGFEEAGAARRIWTVLRGARPESAGHAILRELSECAGGRVADDYGDRTP